jgi:hypothetical protein
MKGQKRFLHGLIPILIITFSSLVIAQKNQCLKIGMNVGPPNRYNGSYSMFKNIMFSSTDFSTANPNVNNYSYLPTDVNGYPNAGLPATVTAYTHPNNIQTFYNQIISTTALQATPEDFPWGVLGSATDSCGIYTVFWEGSGMLKLIYNRYVGATGAQIIMTPGTYGTITTSGASYYSGDKVVGAGISGISTTTITTNNMAGLHYCQFRIPNGLNTDSRGGFDVTLMVSQPAPNHLRNIALVYPNARALGNSMGVNPSMTKILPSQPYNAFVDPKNPEFFLNKPFNPMYLNWFRGFKILRFKDMMGADGIDYTYDQTWATRRPKGYYSQSTFHDGKVGVSMAYEWIIDMANEVGADPWISASTTGDENHYQQMAKLFRQTLDPSLTLYLELGNEQWNFAQGFNTFFMLNNYAINNNIPYGPNGAAAVKEGQLWKAFFNEYGIDSLKCKRVCSGFPGNPDVTRGKVLYHKVLKQDFDYLSMTWYFSNTGPMSGNENTYWGGVGDLTGPYSASSTTPAQYNAELKARIATPVGYGGFVDEILSMTNMANGLGKKVLGYEGGIGSWEASSGRTLQDPGVLSKFDPSIRDLYKVVLDTIRNHPEIEAINHFTDIGGNDAGPQNCGYYGY